MMNNITAKEFLKKENLNKLLESKPNNHLEIIMIEFAQYHVIKALEAASKQSKVITQKAIFVEGCWNESIVDKNSILNAYSESNII